MNRRAFVGGLGSAAAWPLIGQAQPERTRRVGALMNFEATDVEGQARFEAFLNGLQQLGWINGRNVRIDSRWAGSDPEYIRKQAIEMLGLTPEVILASATITLVALVQATRTIPIVFASAIDPVGTGLIAGMARPGGNATGFVAFEYSMSAKWLELLKEIAPGVTRAAVLWEPGLTVGNGQLNAIRAAARSINIEVTPIDVRDPGDLERSLAEFALSPNGGAIVTGSPTAAARRAMIVALTEKYRLPTVYVQRYYVSSGGLISYAPSTTEPYRLAAGYVDRILKGEKPADLPVQAPTKYELVINIKTAKTLGLDIPQSLLAPRRRGHRMMRQRVHRADLWQSVAQCWRYRQTQVPGVHYV